VVQVDMTRVVQVVMTREFGGQGKPKLTKIVYDTAPNLYGMDYD
jgi:hypothetical protein